MTPHNRPARGFLLYPADDVHLAKLPQRWRRLVELATNLGMKYVDIAEEEGLPLGTVKSRINRGRQMVQQLRAQAAVEKKK